MSMKQSGKMAVDQPVRMMIAISRQLNERIEDFRFGSRIKTQAEAIRRLLEAGLVAEGVKKKASRKTAR